VGRLGDFGGSSFGNHGAFIPWHHRDCFGDGCFAASFMSEKRHRPQETIVEIARSQVGFREVGRNQGEWIKKYWEATHYKEGYENHEPYCAAFVCWVLLQASIKDKNLSYLNPCRSASVREWVPWALKPMNGCIVFKPHDGLYVPEPGDIVDFLNKQVPLSHIGIVTGFYGKTVETIEANTSGSSGGNQRDGDGVFEKERNYDFCGHFIRIPARGEENL
jgi:hypothetical protein